MYLNFSNFRLVGVLLLWWGREIRVWKVRVRPCVAIFFLFNRNTVNNRSRLRNGQLRRPDSHINMGHFIKHYLSYLWNNSSVVKSKGKRLCPFIPFCGAGKREVTKSWVDVAILLRRLEALKSPAIHCAHLYERNVYLAVQLEVVPSLILGWIWSSVNKTKK